MCSSTAWCFEILVGGLSTTGGIYKKPFFFVWVVTFSNSTKTPWSWLLIDHLSITSSWPWATDHVDPSKRKYLQMHQGYLGSNQQNRMVVFFVFWGGRSSSFCGFGGLFSDDLSKTSWYMRLSLLPQPWTLKASTDGTYRFMFNQYILLPLRFCMKTWRKDLSFFLSAMSKLLCIKASLCKSPSVQKLLCVNASLCKSLSA